MLIIKFTFMNDQTKFNYILICKLISISSHVVPPCTKPYYSREPWATLTLTHCIPLCRVVIVEC